MAITILRPRHCWSQVATANCAPPSPRCRPATATSIRSCPCWPICTDTPQASSPRMAAILSVSCWRFRSAIFVAGKRSSRRSGPTQRSRGDPAASTRPWSRRPRRIGTPTVSLHSFPILFADDQAAANTFFRLGFGVLAMDAMRDLSPPQGHLAEVETLGRNNG